MVLSLGFDVNSLSEKDRNMFLALLRDHDLRQESVTAYLADVRGHLNPRVWKQMKKALRERVRVADQVRKAHWEAAALSPGPRFRDKDLRYLGEKVANWARSPFAEGLHSERLRIFIFGSLVNGYCNNPRKAYFGRPSDEGRLSDVDMLIVISDALFNDLFASTNPQALITIRSFPRTLPIGLDTNPGPSITGPFQTLFEDFQHINFASMRSRPVHVIFLPDAGFDDFNVSAEPHAYLGEFTTP